MTSVKSMDKVRNGTVLASLSRHDLIHTLRSRQLRFLQHNIILRSDQALCALCEPTHGETRRGRPRINYINYIQKVTGHQLPELTELSQNREDWRQLVVECADPQPSDWREIERERERERERKLKMLWMCLDPLPSKYALQHFIASCFQVKS